MHLACLQGFADVNRRVSRLAANRPLIRGNPCPLSFVDVPERADMDGVLDIYERNRIELLRAVLIWAYERSSARYLAVRQSLGEPDPFRPRYRARFVEVVEAEIMSLHEGNIARYRLRPAEYQAWRPGWH